MAEETVYRKIEWEFIFYNDIRNIDVQLSCPVFCYVVICNELRTEERSMVQDKTVWVKHSQSSVLLVFPDTDSTLHAFFIRTSL